MNLQKRLESFFSKDSKLNGRVVIGLILAVYFISIFCSSFFMDYAKYWQMLGVPAASQLFSDLKAVTIAIKCSGATINSTTPNPCNSWFAYPKIWYLFSSIWVSPDHVAYMAVALISLFYFTTFILLGRINVNAGIYYALLLCSPPMMLAIERGQPDLIIFILCGAAIWCMRKRISVYGAGTLLMFAGFLKLYPLATVISFLNGNKKTSLRLLSILTIIGTAYILFNRTDIQSLSNSLTKNYWSVSVGFMHGCLVFFTLLNTYSFFHRLFHYIPYPVISYSFVTVIMIVVFISSRKKGIITFNSDHIFSFRVGASLYVGSFLIGNNYDYKFIVFIFTIPQLLAWLKNAPQVKIITICALLAILITCWSFFLSYVLYWVIYTFMEESLNWFIFGYFVFMLFNTIPEWTKSLLGFRDVKLSKE